MDAQTGSNNQLLTNGQDTWSASGESRTPGAGGDLRETTRQQRRHPRPQVYLTHDRVGRTSVTGPDEFKTMRR